MEIPEDPNLVFPSKNAFWYILLLKTTNPQTNFKWLIKHFQARS